MLLHTKTLALLLRHRRKGRAAPSPALLALLTDYTSLLDLPTLCKLLYEDAAPEQIEALGKRLLIKARAYKHPAGTVCMWPRLPPSVADILLAARGGAPRWVSMSPAPVDYIPSLKKARKPVEFAAEQPVAPVAPSPCADVSELDLPSSSLGSTIPTGTPTRAKRRSLKAQPTQTSVLNFPRVDSAQVSATEKFAPLVPRGATFVYDKSSVCLDTIRRRDDLVRPVKLQFIRHWDQRRPPIYRTRGRMLAVSHSYQKMGAVDSYSDDSSADWEEQLSESSGSEESVSESDSADSVVCEDDPDSEEEAVKQPRTVKKPIFVTDKVQVVTYFDVDKYACVPLLEQRSVPESIARMVDSEIGRGVALSHIAKVYNISEPALQAYANNRDG